MQIRSRLERQREDEILAVALQLVCEVGIDRASLDTVASRAGVSKATLYRRWPSRSQLIVAAVRRRAKVEFAFADQGGFRADVLCALRLLADWLARDAPVIRALVDAGRRDPALQAEMDRQFVQPHDAMWEDLVVDRARERGDLRHDVDLSWLNELCEAVLFRRILLMDGTVSDAYLERFADEVVLPLFARSSA